MKTYRGLFFLDPNTLEILREDFSFSDGGSRRPDDWERFKRLYDGLIDKDGLHILVELEVEE